MSIVKSEVWKERLTSTAVFFGIVGIVLGVINIVTAVFGYISSVEMVGIFGVLQVITGIDLLLLAILWFPVFNLRGADWDAVPMWILIVVSIVPAGFAAHRALILDTLIWWVPLVHLALLIVSVVIPKQRWYQKRFDPYKRV